MRRTGFAALLAIVLVAVVGCTPVPPPAVDVVRVVGHDTTAFTQGLQVVDNLIVETTGIVGESAIRVLDHQGNLLVSRPLPRHVFGEGVAVAGGTVWVLTWRDGLILRYTWPALEPLPSLPLDTEGWGACYTQGVLWTSDGSHNLSARDPGTGRVLRVVRVGVDRLNELDCPGDGTVWANVWQSGRIVQVDLGSGHVVRTVDLTGLVHRVGREVRLGPDDVLNGVASMPDGTLWVTGKRWPSMFLIRP